MPRTGQPPKGEKTRELVVNFRLTEREHRYLQALARKGRTDIGSVVRALALAGLPPAKPDETSVPLPRLG